jgi:aspartyl/asparaginyl-tRNA synthetase
LTDQITRCEVYLETTKKRVEIVKSELTLQSMNEPSLANAEARKAWVEAHEAHLVVLFDYLYFKQLYAAQEQRRKKMSKSMDRIYREIMSRDVPNRGTYYGDNKPQFRQVRRPSV